MATRAMAAIAMGELADAGCAGDSDSGPQAIRAPEEGGVSDGAEACQCGDRRRGRGRRRGGQGTGGGRTERGAAGARQVVFGRRLPQGRSAQPAHPVLGANSARTKIAIRACWWIQRARARGAAERRRVQQQRGVRGRRHVQLWRAGVALQEKDFRMRSPTGAGGQHAEDWPISYADLEPYYEKAEWEMGVSGDDVGNPFQSAAPQAAAHASAGAESTNTRSCSRPPSAWDCTRSISPCCATRVPYNGRRSCMRCRWCVGFACEVNARTRHAQHRDSDGAGHRQLRAAHRSAWRKEILLDEPRPRHGRGLFRCATTGCRSRPPTW